MGKKKHMTAGRRPGKDARKENLEQGMAIIRSSPLFAGIGGYVRVMDRRAVGKEGAAVVSSDGTIILNQEMLLTPGQWAYVIAHCQLHLAFGHFDGEKMPMDEDSPGDNVPDTGVSAMGGRPRCDPALWNLACDMVIAKFLADMKFGEPICADPAELLPGSLTDEGKIYAYLKEHIQEEACQQALHQGYGTAAPGGMDLRDLEHPLYYDSGKGQYNRYARQFAWGLSAAVSAAVGKAGGHDEREKEHFTPAVRAARWFVNHYPLLGGIASAFRIIEQGELCRQMEIQIAAVDAGKGEIYVNPAAHLDEEELKFVLAHEFLHAGLGHGERCQGRDPGLWNAACDFVINGWLAEMEIGRMPAIGVLYDERLKDKSAEEVYDQILQDVRQYSRLAGFRGYGKGDIIRDSGGNVRGFGGSGAVSLDDFCRRALMEGLEYHQSNGRGLIPAGLVEEIRALMMPPIPWDVELARWFEEHFPDREKRRTYARPSRRQGATPAIPRPRYVEQDALGEGRTFGVVVDTSGSMSPELLGMALGSIASYGAAREVPLVRVVFCDARAYDAGYMAPEEIAGRVQVKGRGGTILQPGVDLLEHAQDFPKNGPILIITDGWIEEKMMIRREHAFLVPKGRRLPFRVRGKVFYFSRQ